MITRLSHIETDACVLSSRPSTGPARVLHGRAYGRHPQNRPGESPPQEETYAPAGWLAGEEVPVLEQACGPAVAQGLRLVLDLHGVRSIDAAGLSLLARWAGHRLSLRRPSSYIRQLLEGQGLRCETEA